MVWIWVLLFILIIRKKNKLVLGKGPTEGLVTAEKVYWISFTITNKKFCLSLHCNGANSYVFVNGTEFYKFKVKDFEIFVDPICLGNISKDWSVDKTKWTGFTGYVYDFSVDYNANAIDDIKNIHKYLMKKNNIISNVNRVNSFIKLNKCNPLSCKNTW